MADPTNAKIRDGVQKPLGSIDGNELIELDDLAINTGDPNFYNSSLSVMSDWYNNRWRDQQAPSGFLKTIDEIASITFDDGSRTLTITPVASTFNVYSSGIKFTKTGVQNKVIADTEGNHWFYYDENGNLLTFANPDFIWQTTILRKYAIVAILYWDKTNQETIYFTGKKELHGMNFPATVHAHLHFTEGTKYLSGCQLGDLQIDQSGALDSHAQFSLTTGQIQDEDLLLSLIGVLSTTGLPIFYLDGASEYLRRQFNSGFSVLTTGTGRLAWNEWTGSAWQLTEVNNNKYVNYFVFAYNDGTYTYCSFVGQTEYNSKKDAEEAATTEAFTIIKGAFPIQEAIGAAVVTFQTSDSYGNAVKARVVAALDITKSNLNTALSLNLNHNTLAGLQLAEPSGVTWGHVDADLYALFINPEQKNIYYFKFSGNDSYDGKCVERSVLDSQVAINLAQALTPASNKKFVIKCSDAYEYSSPSNLYSWISIYAPAAKFKGGAISIADNTSIVLDHFDNEGVIGRALLKTGSGSSSWRIRRIDGRIDMSAGTVFVTCDQLIAPSAADEYISVPAGTTLYIRAHKIKSKITVAATGTLYIDVDDSSEITENFAVGAIVYTNYKDKKNPRKTIDSGTFNVEPWHEGYRFTNKGASTDINLMLPPADATMFNRKPIYFEVSDSGTLYINIITDGTNKIRVLNVLDSELKSKTNGCLVGLFVNVIGEWTVITIVGEWELVTKP